MNPIHKVIDAQGLPCPQPVILARKALAEGGFDTLDILVDDAASRENLLKFAAYAKCEVEAVTTDGPRTTLRLKPGTTVASQPASAPAPAATQAATVLITADGLGQGDPDLARLLMRGFLYTLTECDAPPMQVIFMNAGVRLAVEGSESLANLRKLADRGVDILACGTCLEFYKLTETLGVGRITNMYEIAELLLQGRATTLN
jgi:selenium metabolism protein YedF